MERKQKRTLNALRCLCEYIEKSTGFKAECVLMIWKTNLEAPIYEILRNLKSYNRVMRIKQPDPEKISVLRNVANKFINRTLKIMSLLKIRKRTNSPKLKSISANLLAKPFADKLNPAINKMLFPNQANVAFQTQINKSCFNGFVHKNFWPVLNIYGWLVSVFYFFL